MFLYQRTNIFLLTTISKKTIYDYPDEKYIWTLTGLCTLVRIIFMK